MGYEESSVAAPLRIQLLAIVGIFAFTAFVGGAIFGTKALLGALWVDATCEDACHRHESKLVEVDYQNGRQGNHSACVCANGERIASSQANTAADLSILFSIVISVALPLAILWLVLRRRSLRRPPPPA